MKRVLLTLIIVLCACSHSGAARNRTLPAGYRPLHEDHGESLIVLTRGNPPAQRYARRARRHHLAGATLTTTGLALLGLGLGLAMGGLTLDEDPGLGAGLLLGGATVLSIGLPLAGAGSLLLGTGSRNHWEAVRTANDGR